MESRFIVLDQLQSAVLAATFEAIYSDNDDNEYMKFVEADEIFYVMIGGDLDPELFNLIERSCVEDVASYLTAINLQDWLDVIRQEAETLEYFEICNNCRIFIDELESILTRTDEHYSQHSSDILQCSN